MLRALFRKQILEMNVLFFQDKKTNKRRSKAGIVGYILLFAFVFFSCGMAFAGIGMAFGPAFIPNGLSWLYFALLSVLTIFGSSLINMFIANSSLFSAKDNDLLLSLPIEPSKILLVRMIGLYLWGLLYDVIIFLPVIIVYWIIGGVSISKVIFPILVMLINSFVILVLSCAFGWIVALISSRLKNKSITTVIVALLLIGLYYFMYFRFEKVMFSIIEHVNETSMFVKSWMIPFYHIGMACSGNIGSLIIVLIISLILFTLVYYLLSKNFISIVTRNIGDKKKEYKAKEVKESSANSTLLKRELKHFVSSPALMLNTGLGILFFPAGGIILLVKSKDIMPVLESVYEAVPILKQFIAPFIIVASMLLISMCCFTASTISLEGKNLWIVKTIPVDTKTYLGTKLKTQLILFVIPTIAFSLMASFALHVDQEYIPLILVMSLVFLMLSAAVGLYLNLNRHSFDWTSETYVVKQGLPVTVNIFGGWAVAIVFGAACYFLSKYVDPVYVCYGFLIIFVLAYRLLLNWIYTKGVEVFDNI